MMRPPVPPHSDHLDRARFPSFDGLRALAILPVVLHHSTSGPMPGILGRGPLGVDLFFALSGFLITNLLLREKETTGAVRLGAFWARRALRIMPLYYGVLAVFALHAVFLREPGPVRDHFLHSLPVHLTYTSNFLLDTNVPHAIVFGFGWSLATEEQFYALWPLVLGFARRTRAAAAGFMIVLLVVDQLTERGFLDAFVSGVPFRVLRSISTPIVLGSLLALALRVRAGYALFALVLARRCSSLVAFAVVAYLAWSGGSLLLAHVAMVGLVGACALRPDHLLAPILEHPIARFIGDRSYGLYLLNIVATVLVKRHLGEDAPLALIFALALGLSLLMAHVAHVLVERPLMAARARLRR
ncbi:MAG: acyltransferase [Labilithrix sp.]